ncbi:MAG TPA: cytochrome o ubiquinol oxidase subunit IV, partial [Trinickia sp.]|nr:cytochrome o ubiquinol oxidase subunit IV [Trinickia sp.]
MALSHSSQLEESHGSVSGYLAGFVLSVVLTAASFGLVMGGMLSPHASLIALAALAFVQIVVHLVYFLHMNGSSGQRWNVMAFSYTVLTAVILIVGSMWI